MHSLARLCQVLVVATVLSTTGAHAEQRIALIVGNADYKTFPALKNPVNDVALMARTLRAVGFDVVKTENASRNEMVRAVREFGRALGRADSDAVGLFFYAGHGVQADGVNYLLPVSAPIEKEADLEVEAINAGFVLRQMQDAGNQLNILILDACRDNPLQAEERSGLRGLARMTAPSGAVISYSAGPNQRARDGTGDNSPYVQALVRAIKSPGLRLVDLFRQVRSDVERVTGGEQTPWEETALKTGVFYFSPPQVAHQTPPTSTLTSDDEDRYWQTVEGSGNWQEFQSYIDRFGEDARYADIARTRRDKLKAQEGTLPDPTAVAMESGYSGDKKRNIQLALKRLGHYSGPKDAVFGVGTRKGIKAFQASIGEARTGYLTAAQLERLLATIPPPREAAATSSSAAEAAAGAKETKVAAASTGGPTLLSETTGEDLYWKQIKDSADPDDFADYLHEFGASAKYAEIARARMRRFAPAVASASPAARESSSDPTYGPHNEAIVGASLTQADLRDATDAVLEAKRIIEELAAKAGIDASTSNQDLISSLLKLRGMLGQVVDFEIMARYVLGDHRAGITRAEWDAFLLQYQELFLSGYKLPPPEDFTGTIEFEGVRPTVQNDIMIHVLLGRQGKEPTRVVFRVRRKPEALFGYMVVDAYIDSVSVLQVQRSEFDFKLRTAGVTGLTKELARIYGAPPVLEVPVIE